MAFPALDEEVGKLDAVNKKMAAVFAEAGQEMDLSKVKSVKGSTFDIAAQIRAWNDEATTLGKNVDDLKAVAKAADRAKMAGDGAAESGDGAAESDAGRTKQTKSIGELFVESKAFTGRQGQNGPVSTLPMNLKTLLTTTAGWAPEILRNDRLVEFATRPIQVADMIPQTTTAQAGVQYMEETTLTNAAAEIAEGGTYAESALAYTERLTPVQKIATFIPVTDEQLEDIPRMRGVLDNRLPFFIRQRLDLQLLTGNGTAPNLRGLLNIVGIQTQAKGADPGPDAIYKAMVKLQTGTGQCQPNLIIMNPVDWQNIRLLRTADGIYIWGNPSDTGPQRMWGLTVALAQAETAATAIVTDTSFLELAVRSGVDVQVSNSHSTFFVEGKQAIRADIRAAFVVYRPTAVCTVTGL
jgi:HK97 family phage major capsid protein